MHVRIIAEIHKVIDSITEIRRAEVASVMAGDLKPGESIELHVRELRELKALLMDRLSPHCAEHGCAGQ